jgi:subtilisin family serine protease
MALLAITAMMLSGRKQNVQAEKKNIVTELPEQFVPGRVLVKFHDNILPAHARNIIAALGARDASEIPNIGVHILDLPYQANEKAFVSAFQARSEVEFAELDRILAPAEIIPNDPFYSTGDEWHLLKIGAPTAWSMSTGNSDVTIAILDTGVDGTHLDLASKMIPGWNVYDNNSNTSDVYGHGTQVAGVAAASSNNGQGVASIAWGCRIMPIRISAANGGASYSAMASGLNWAADHGANVANISYIASDSAAVRTAAQYFQSKGGVVVASAGNNTTFDSAADNPYILTVSATDPTDVLSYWSNTGNNVDIAAPEGAETTLRGGGYTYAGGTSISSPIVAGVAALVISANPSLTPTEVQTILKQNSDDLGSSGWDTSYGWGRVNAARAVAAAAGAGAADTSPPTVSFAMPTGGVSVQGTVTVQVSASDNLGVTSVNTTVDGLSLGTDTAGPYTFQWNTTLHLNGLHTLIATATDAAGNASSTSISVNVNNVSVDAAPPSVLITSPANGSKISTSVSVYVNTSDNVRVSKVELYVDGFLTATSTSVPFATKWNSRKTEIGAHTLQCKAYDAAGNAGVSQVITVYK